MSKSKKEQSSSITIYANSCTTCGVNAVYVARVRKLHPEVTVINSRADKSKLEEHINYQKQAGMGSTPVPIVVEGDTVTLLNQWK